MPYYFNLPIFDDLTPDQKMAVNETRQLALGGGPGTGKSVVCLWRHISNYATNTKKSLLLTYTKTLEHYLKQSIDIENELARANVNRFDKWLPNNGFDEIIIDEGQDVTQDRFQQFFNYSENVSYGADKRQSLYLSSEELNKLFEWFRNDERFNSNVNINLSRNFRNSKEILMFTRSVFPDFFIPQITLDSSRSTGLKPIMKLNKGREMSAHCSEIVSIVNDFYVEGGSHNISVLVPKAAMVDNYYTELVRQLNKEIIITKYQNEHDIFSGISNVHITTFKSAKGTEFDTVIIPEFEDFMYFRNKGRVVTVNDYYVAFTRAKSNLFLICKTNNPNIGDKGTVTYE